MDQDGTAGRPRGRSEARSSRDAVTLSDLTQRRIGLHLRTMYDAVVQQPVPDRFRDLIAKLEATEPLSDD